MKPSSDHRDIIVRVDEALKHIQADIAKIESRLPENLSSRLSSVEQDTESLSKWRTGIVAIGGFVMTILTFATDALGALFKGIH